MGSPNMPIATQPILPDLQIARLRNHELGFNRHATAGLPGANAMASGSMQAPGDLSKSLWSVSPTSK